MKTKTLTVAFTALMTLPSLAFAHLDDDAHVHGVGGFPLTLAETGGILLLFAAVLLCRKLVQSCARRTRTVHHMPKERAEIASKE